jgi:hypothetical protein
VLVFAVDKKGGSVLVEIYINKRFFVLSWVLAVFVEAEVFGGRA